jgi:hypothetical protein
MTVSDHLITSRRNFLVRATAYTAAGGAVTVPIVTIPDVKARVQHHLDELHKALRDLYPQTTFFVRSKLPDQITDGSPCAVIVVDEAPVTLRAEFLAQPVPAVRS